MKKPFIYSLFLVGSVLILFSACTSGTQSQTTETRQQNPGHSTEPVVHMQANENNLMMQSMSRMMDRMHTLKMSGNPDRDFAEMMIIHHQGAVDMSKAELASGKDTVVRNMAAAIMATQEGEIAKMQNIASGFPAPASDVNRAMADDPLMKAMSAMMQASHAIQMTGDADKDFVVMMLPHHEGAVEMAKVHLKQGHSAELKHMAQQMIDDQMREISRFKQWLAAHP